MTLTIATPEPPRLDDSWEQHGALADDQLRAVFLAAKQDADAVSRGFRTFAAALKTRGIVGMDEYVAVFGGRAAVHLTQSTDGRFTDMASGADATELARRYSRAKHGSIEDIRHLAGRIVSMLEHALRDPDSDWRRLFEHARARSESVAMMTTGWRNVPSTANVLYAIVLEHLNVFLAGLDLPTIVEVKLPRIAPPCENYASLSTEERQRISLTQDHVIPGPDFYRWSAVHVIFGDDVLVTGSTADKVFEASMRNGARSFRSLYAIALDPGVALRDPSIEERLNLAEVSGALDEVVAAFLAHPGNVPILRALRLVFAAANRPALPAFVQRLPPANLLALYVSALGNEFQREVSCAASLSLVQRHLVAHGLLDAQGLPRRPWAER
ncbi:hypothetical protein [Ideonella sp. B508-1]|uniref:hypothetical protein n=1 Tax=Ideonella sp. B508-1 TaxID=137716 RepID=UPI000347F01C|nr:hypothetical protein [Ideonella sp. B508-1]